MPSSDSTACDQPLPKEDTLPLLDEKSFKDISNDFDRVLNLFTLSVDGDFYSAEQEEPTPDPCLNIEGVGAISLPLNHKDALSIKEHAAQAPFGMRDETIIDTSVRNTWEISPSKIKFENPAWQQFIKDDVVGNVCESLGVGSLDTPPTCELYKLLLYETGSHFLPHQDTEKTPGMFATVIIVLPSVFTGGDVHLHHDGKTDIIDTAQVSDSGTSIIAWYTDVMHEVKPITSGYRLALSYNLVHAPSSPLPQFPKSQDITSQFHSSLSRWSNSSLLNESDSNFWNYLACRLEHQYSGSNLFTGTKGLKGHDAHLMAYLRPIVDELGFFAFLANVELYLTGPRVYDEEGEYRPNRYDNDYDYLGPAVDKDGNDRPDDNDPLSGFVRDHIYPRLTIQCLVDLDGTNLKVKDVEIASTTLVPRGAFMDEDPDETAISEYIGNEGGDLEHWYYRTILLLIPLSNVYSKVLKAVGPTYAISQLGTASPDSPTARDKKLAYMIIAAYDKPEVQCLLRDYTIKWKDLDLWKKVEQEARHKNLDEAWQAFGFQNVKADLEKYMVTPSQTVGERITFLHSLPPISTNEDQAMIQSWCSAQELRIFESYGHRESSDIPYMISAGKQRGVAFLLETILPTTINKRPDEQIPFLIEFVMALHKNKASIPDLELPGPSNALESPRFHILVQQCLDIIWKLWTDHHGLLPNSSVYSVGYLVNIIDVCLSVGHANYCEKLYSMLEEMKADNKAQHKFPYVQLFEEIVPILHKHDLKISSPPFEEFFLSLIQVYIQGSHEPPPVQNEINIRHIGCGCADCQAINDLIEDKSLRQRTLQITEPQVTDIKLVLTAAEDLVTYYHTFQELWVRKVPDLVSTQEWQVLMAANSAFLQSLGEDEDVLGLIGDKATALLKEKIRTVKNIATM